MRKWRHRLAHGLTANQGQNQTYYVEGGFVFIEVSIWVRGPKLDLSMPHLLTYLLKWPLRRLRTGLETSDLYFII